MDEAKVAQPVYLSLGSNLGDREHNLRAAIAELRRELSITSVSSIYETDPVGVEDQPRFLNLALAGETALSPHELLALAKRVERDIGRVPNRRWGPRAIDVDILLYGDKVIEDHDLVIPHPEMARRAFVLVPLAEVAPQVRHPVLGQTIETMREAAPRRGTAHLVRLRADH